MDEEYFWGRGFYCKKRINCLHNDILVLFIFYIIKLVRKKDCICIEDYSFRDEKSYLSFMLQNDINY